MRIKIAVVSSLLVLLLSASIVTAQDFRPDDRYNRYPKSLIQWPAALPDLNACKKNEYYEPADFHLIKYINRVRIAKIEEQKTDKCVYMLTQNKWRWVMRPAGTKVAYDDKDRELFDLGSPKGKPCGNPRNYSFIVAVAETVPESEVKPQPPAQVKQPAAVEKPILPSVPVELTITTVSQPESQLWGWGFTSGGTLGAFSSAPISGIVNSISDRSVCSVEGQTFDVGLAFGGPSKSFWRFTFASMSVKDGSFTRYTCINCNAEVTAVSQSMKVWGGKLERVQRLGPRNWRVWPMASLHAGGGRVSGYADQYIGPIGQPTTRLERVEAEHLFGSKFFVLVGGGLGFMGDLGRHLTYSITVAGVQYPGVYYGGVQLTYWP